MQNVVIFSGLCPSESLTRGFATGPHMGQAPRPFHRLALSRLLQLFWVILYLLDHFCTTISAPLRKIATSKSFSSTASHVWDELPVRVSSALTLPVFRRQAPFIPSCLPWIHYTDHQSRNLLQYHVVHLTRSSPAPTISRFLHSRLGLARCWRACKYCVTYSLTNKLGKREVCFRSPKMYQKLSYCTNNAEFKKFSQGQNPVPLF